jgi:hypothetical protein
MESALAVADKEDFGAAVGLLVLVVEEAVKAETRRQQGVAR